MSFRISDIATHNAAPGAANKIEMENPTGPASEWATLGEVIAANAGVAGFRFTFNTATSGDPGSGKFLFNNATFASATQVNISSTDANANDLSTFMLTRTTFTGRCEVHKPNGAYFFFSFSAMAYLEGGTYFTLLITPETSGGTISNADTVYLIFDTTSACASFPRITQITGTTTVAEVEAATKAARMTIARSDMPSNYDLFSINSYRMALISTISSGFPLSQHTLSMAWLNGAGFAVIRQITLGLSQHASNGDINAHFDLYRYPYVQSITGSTLNVKNNPRLRNSMRGSLLQINGTPTLTPASQEATFLGSLNGVSSSTIGQMIIPITPIYEMTPGVEPLILQGWEALAIDINTGGSANSATVVHVTNMVWDEWVFNPPK